MFEKYRELILYIFFGGLTTLVNYAVYYPLYNLAHWDPTASNAVAWIVSVVFAFVTNKPFVFGSHDWRICTVAHEAASFVSARIFSGLLETGFIFLFVTVMNLDGNIIKLLVSIAVIILNYITSKFLVFHK